MSVTSHCVDIMTENPELPGAVKPHILQILMTKCYDQLSEYSMLRYRWFAPPSTTFWPYKKKIDKLLVGNIVNPVKYGSTSRFSLGLYLNTFYRWRLCMRKCQLRHEPLHPYEILWILSLGASDFLFKYSGYYLSLESHIKVFQNAPGCENDNDWGLDKLAGTVPTHQVPNFITFDPPTGSKDYEVIRLPCNADSVDEWNGFKRSTVPLLKPELCEAFRVNYETYRNAHPEAGLAEYPAWAWHFELIPQ